MNNYYVYFHHRKSDGVLFYIGKGSGSRYSSTSRRSSYWKNTVNKHGLSIEIVDCGLSEKQAFELEVFCIDFFKDKAKLVNMTIGGEGLSGYKHTESSKKKIVESLVNRVITPETRKKLSELNKGKKLSTEHRKKLSQAKIGKHQGMLNPFSDKRLHLFQRVDDEKVENCTRQELCRKYNLTSDQIKKLFTKNPRQTSKGWRLLNGKQ